MQLTDHPDKVVPHRPTACRGCGHHLAEAVQTGMERRQVTELPEVKAVGCHRASADRAGVPVLRAADEGGRSGRGDGAGAVRAAGRGHEAGLVAALPELRCGQLAQWFDGDGELVAGAPLVPDLTDYAVDEQDWSSFPLGQPE